MSSFMTSDFFTMNRSPITSLSSTSHFSLGTWHFFHPLTHDFPFTLPFVR
jgi:hypothetical protein